MKKVIALTDYKNQFGSKWKASPYRSGYDKNLLQKYARKYGLEMEFLPILEASKDLNRFRDEPVVYTSSEEFGYHYKSYIEDVVFALENSGVRLIPSFNFLRANNNKVYMELLRDVFLGEELSGLKSHVYGTLEELKMDMKTGKIRYPCVLKKAEGAMSRGVFLAQSEEELIENIKGITSSSTLKHRMKEKIRTIRHNGYKPESFYQNKFIVQPFIPGLKNDWKILIYGDHYYILKRGIKENDFRASGSGHDYKAGKESGFPLDQLNTVEKIYQKLNTPHLSLDVAYDGKKLYVIEIQAVYFGTATLEYCNEYYIKKAGAWVIEEQVFDQEQEYMYGLAEYLDQNDLL